MISRSPEKIFERAKNNSEFDTKYIEEYCASYKGVDIMWLCKHKAHYNELKISEERFYDNLIWEFNLAEAEATSELWSSNVFIGFKRNIDDISYIQNCVNYTIQQKITSHMRKKLLGR